MKTIKTVYMATLLCSLVALLGCESTADDAARTPIGSVITGETRSTQSYLDRVRQENAAQQNKNSWMPESPDRL